jgi:hypothetical protein
MGVSGEHHAPAALYPRGRDPRYPLDRRLGGPQSRVWTQGLEEKSSVSVGDRTPVVQSVVRHYTDWATPAPNLWILTSIIYCVIILCYVPSVLKMLKFCWTVSSIFITTLITYIFSQGLKMLGFIRYITSSFSTDHILCVLYSTLVRPKLKYAFVAWNHIASTDSSKLERVQRKFAALWYGTFFVGVFCNNYEGILASLNLSTLYSRPRHLDVLFLVNVFRTKVCCSSIFDSVNIRIPTRIIRDYIYG